MYFYLTTKTLKQTARTATATIPAGTTTTKTTRNGARDVDAFLPSVLPSVKTPGMTCTATITAQGFVSFISRLPSPTERVFFFPSFSLLLIVAYYKRVGSYSANSNI